MVGCGDLLPSETDLATVTDAQLQAIADKMNATPRKWLGYIAPIEAFSRLSYDGQVLRQGCLRIVTVQPNMMDKSLDKGV